MSQESKIPDKVNHEIAQPLFQPLLAAALSLILPGLGQFVSRSFRRGLLLLCGFVTILAMLAWRFRLAAPYDEGFTDIVAKAFHLQPFLLLLSILAATLYLWIILDAYLIARWAGEVNHLPLFLFVLVIYFALGWQIGEIKPILMITEADEAGPALLRVLWPWERALEYPQELLVGIGKVQTPCTDVPYPATEPKENAPYVLVEPTCGVPSEQDGPPGTSFHLRGKNFVPNTETEIWWKDALGNEFRQRQEGKYVKVTTGDQGEFEVDIIMPYRLLPSNVAKGTLEWEVQGRQIASIGKPVPSVELKLAIEKIVETIFIGMMATFFGIILAIPVSFLAARNLMSASRFTLAIYFIVRSILNIIRSIEPLIWAIIAVIVVGLGPFAGILALSLHSLAALGKLYSEAIESIDPGPIEAIQATGANWVQTIIYAVIPQVIPPFVSFTIYRWDINIRMSTVIGFVGGGGIGFLLAQWIRLLDYRSAGIAVWFIAITVAILDYVSAEIRARFV